jgi:hypothetical protein
MGQEVRPPHPRKRTVIFGSPSQSGIVLTVGQGLSPFGESFLRRDEVKLNVFRVVRPWAQSSEICATTHDMSGMPDYFLVKTIDIDLGDVPDVDFQKLLSEQREREIKSLRARLERLECVG